MPGYQITEYCHRMIKEHIKEGDCCVDATAGNGNDTEFLCRLTGADGKVYAFDIQKAAVEHTKKRLEEAGLTERAKVILDGHEHMEKKYAYLFGIVNLVVTCLVLALVGIPLGNLLF